MGKRPFYKIMFINIGVIIQNNRLSQKRREMCLCYGAK